MILGADDRKRWDKWDRVLAEAHQIIENERCPQCGYPVYLCQNESEIVQFRLNEESCAIEAKKANHGKRGGRDGKAKDLPPGTVLRPEVYLTNGEDPVTVREPFYKAQRAKREEMEKSLHRAA
jgi:hypothetical protein